MHDSTPEAFQGGAIFEENEMKKVGEGANFVAGYWGSGLA
jgi:hypothetical protein